MKIRIRTVVPLLVIAAALAEGAERDLAWLRGRSRHVPAGRDHSVVIECKSYRGEWGRCEIEIVLRDLIPGDNAWAILERGEKYPRPRKDQQYILARFYLKVLEKEGAKLFHVDHTLFNAIAQNGIVYPGEYPLKNLSPSIIVDLHEGVEYEGWVCFQVKDDDSPVAVFGRKWASEAFFTLCPERDDAGAGYVAYKGELRSETWVKNKFKVHRRNFARADELFVSIHSVPVRRSRRSTRPRRPDDGEPSIDEIKMRFGRKKSAEAGQRSAGIILESDEISRFEVIGDWGWIKGNVAQVLGPRELLVNAEDMTFHIGDYAAADIIDGSPFEGWLEIVGTHRYLTVRGSTRTVWDCRVMKVDFTYPITLDLFKQLLKAGVELYRWEETGEKCPQCDGRGKVIVQQRVVRTIGNIINRRTIEEIVPVWVKCDRCNGSGRLERSWRKVKDY